MDVQQPDSPFQKTASRWIDQLIDLTGNNKLLFFKSTAGTVTLDPNRVPKLFEGASLRLGDLTEAIRLITGEQDMLQNNQTLQKSIHLRNPYVDALSYFQISLLKAWRSSGRTRDDLKRAVLLSINGVANGMRNTG